MSQGAERDLFGAEVGAMDPARPGTFAEYDIAGKIVRVPRTTWKDGRVRDDLTAWGEGEIVSRNAVNHERRVRERLEPHFRALLENSVAEVLRQTHEARTHRRERKKAAGKIQLPAEPLFFDPRNEFTKEPFSSTFDSILRRKNSEITPLAKLLWGVIRARLWMAYQPKRKEIRPGKVGLIVSTAELARSTGSSPDGIHNALNSMKRIGLVWWPEGAGAWTLTVFLLKHESFAARQTSVADTEVQREETSGRSRATSVGDTEQPQDQVPRTSVADTEPPYKERETVGERRKARLGDW